MTVVEEVEVQVNEAVEPKPAATPLFDGVRKLVLASIGAVAITIDEAESFVNKLVARGEIAQKDAERLLSEVRARVRVGAPAQQVEQVEERFENGIDHLLNRLNIPSKRDIDELSAKIAQLTARVDELRKQ
jgi:poly(hydroxyalkanoate) granule-associated protein